jgi:trehalose 6-phosphate synthase
VSPGHGPSGHVVLVSDRGPMQFSDHSGRLVPERRKSSVTALLDGLARALPQRVVWVAPSIAQCDAHAARLGLFDGLAERLGYRYVAVPVEKDVYDLYYYDVGVEIIWSAWHGIEDEVPFRHAARYPSTALAGYRAINQALAERVGAVALSGAVVAVQDYQLMLVPALLRDQRPDVRISHFSHTPFPDRMSRTKLPEPLLRSLVLGMLGADLLGFQRPLWARRFLDCCGDLGLETDHQRGCVHLGGHTVWVRSYPVTVDGAALEMRVRSTEVRNWAQRIRAGDPRRVIARVDRLDPAKNAVRGFEAYALALHRRPSLARQVRFVACLVPSREHLPDYQRYTERMWEVVQKVNEAHPRAITVHYGEDQDRALGLLRAYDVLLVNPLADGMNLVAQEGPLLNHNDGVTVLSAGAGAADLLPGVVELDRPRSVEATAAAINAALDLSPGQRRRRIEQMRSAISRLRPADWLDHQLADTVSVGSGGAPCCALPGL